MNKLNKISRLLAFLAIAACSVWIGSYLSRLFITFQLFEAQDLSLKSYMNSSNLPGILITMLPAITTTFISFICFIITFALFIITSGIKLKNNGWLLIISIIVIITLPFEIYLMTIDYHILMQVNNSSFNATEIINLFIKRIKVLGSFPLIEMFSYLSFYYFLLSRPLTKKTDEN
jgi:hypothetical protein